MRALTREEVRFVAGGDNIGDTMIDVGEDLQNWSSTVSFLGPAGMRVGGLMNLAGKALVSQGKKRNESTDIGGGGGGGGSGEGESGGGGSSSGGNGVGGTGGGHQSGCTSGSPDCTVIWHPT